MWQVAFAVVSFKLQTLWGGGKKKNLVLQFRKTLDEDIFFPTPAFPIDKLSSPDHGLFKLLPIWFLTTASKKIIKKTKNRIYLHRFT